MDEVLPEMYYLQGRAYLDSSAYIAALDSLNAALEYDSGHLGALFTKGMN